MLASLWQLFQRPFVFIYVIAKRNLRIHIITEEVNVRLAALIFGKGGEFEESLLDRTIVIYVNRILEHVIDKVWIRLHKIIEHLKNLQILLLPLEESTESHIICVEIDSSNG